MLHWNGKYNIPVDSPSILYSSSWSLEGPDTKSECVYSLTKPVVFGDAFFSKWGKIEQNRKESNMEIGMWLLCYFYRFRFLSGFTVVKLKLQLEIQNFLRLASKQTIDICLHSTKYQQSRLMWYWTRVAGVG